MEWVKWFATYAITGLVIAGILYTLLTPPKERTSKTLQCFYGNRIVQITDVANVRHEKDVLVVFKKNEQMYLTLPPGSACVLVTHNKENTPTLPAPPEEEMI